MNKLKFRKFIHILILVPIALISCSNKGFEIKGKIDNAGGETIYLEHFLPASVVTIDSVKINTKGEFQMSPILPGLGFYRLKLDNNNFVILLCDTADKITFEANGFAIRDNPVIKGSPASKSLADFHTVVETYFIKGDSLNQAYQQYMNHPRLDSITALFQQSYAVMMDEKKNFIKKYINENKTSLLALAAVEQLNPEEDFETFSALNKSLQASIPNSEYVKNFGVRVNAMGRLSIGTAAPEIIVDDPSGNKISLSSLRGKIVLIDFWASWCGPCRKENPNVVALYNKYKNKGFEIFGVSLDRDKAAWLKAIADDKLTWKHGSELAQWNSSFVKTYEVKGIPQTFLIDQKGNIIAKGLRGKALEDKLAELIK